MISLELKMPEGVRDRSYNMLEDLREVIVYLNFYKHYKHSPIGVHIHGTDRHGNEINWDIEDIKSPIHYNAVVYEIESMVSE